MCYWLSLIVVFSYLCTSIFSQEIPQVTFPICGDKSLRTDNNQKKLQIRFGVYQENLNGMAIFGYHILGASEIVNGFPQSGFSLKLRKETLTKSLFVPKSDNLTLYSTYRVYEIKQDEEFIFFDNAIWSYSHCEALSVKSSLSNVVFNVDYNKEDQMKKYGNNFIILPYDSEVSMNGIHIANDPKEYTEKKVFSMSLRVDYTKDQKLDIHLGTNEITKRDINSKFTGFFKISDIKDGDKIEILPGVERNITVVKPKANLRGYILFDLNE